VCLLLKLVRLREERKIQATAMLAERTRRLREAEQYASKRPAIGAKLGG
jgi:hypothetical protein